MAFHLGQAIFVTATGGFKNTPGYITEFLGDYGAVVRVDYPFRNPGRYRFLLRELTPREE